jgi:hypothetical protein
MHGHAHHNHGRNVEEPEERGKVEERGVLEDRADVVVRMPVHVVDFTILGYDEGDGGRSRARIAPKE